VVGGHDTLFLRTDRGFDGHLIWFVEGDPPAQRFGPEDSEPRRIETVNTHALDSDAHGVTLLQRDWADVSE
jgi:hypothetical protein